MLRSVSHEIGRYIRFFWNFFIEQYKNSQVEILGETMWQVIKDLIEEFLKDINEQVRR